MKILRKTLSIFLIIFALIPCLSAYSSFDSGFLDKTIKHSRQIEKTFNSTINYVESNKVRSGRLVSSEEFKAWAAEQPTVFFGVKYLYFYVDDYPPEVIAKFGAAPINSYVLALWRGEWFEYYASWAKKSTLTLNYKEYYYRGSPGLQGIISIILVIFLCWLAYAMWPDKLEFAQSRKSNREASDT